MTPANLEYTVPSFRGYAMPNYAVTWLAMPPTPLIPNEKRVSTLLTQLSPALHRSRTTATFSSHPGQLNASGKSYQ
jgi:hypothetical protein